MSSKKALSQLYSAVSEMRDMYAEIPATTILVFLQIAMKPDTTSFELADRLNLSQAGVSRNLAMLTES